MRILEVKGKTYEIPEDQWEQLMGRFDLENAEDEVINQPCICDEHQNCEVCCLGPKTLNCLRILPRITGMRMPKDLSLTEYNVSFLKHSKYSRKYIDKVHEVLAALPEE